MSFWKKYSPFILLGFALLFSCWVGSTRGYNDAGFEFAPNMYVSVGYEPMSQIEGKKNEINPLGMNMRLPVKGTIPRQKLSKNDSISDLMLYDLRADSIALSAKILKNPVPLTEKSLKEGEVLYERFCMHCHGETGKGEGLVAKMYKGVPVYSSDALKTLNDGHIFHTITYGRNRMWAHGSQISPIDRWKIVHYVHKLQSM